MATDPRKWIYGFLDALPGFLTKPLRWVADRIFGVLDDGVTFAKWIKGGVSYWQTRAMTWLLTLVTLAGEVVSTARWIVTILIPQRVAAAINAVKAWVSPLVQRALNTAKALVNDLAKWAASAINAVKSLAGQVRDFLLGKINAILDRLHRTIDVWADRLTHPDKMAAWLVGALMGPLWRYVYANRSRIMSWFLRSSPAAVQWLARELDAILGRLL